MDFFMPPRKACTFQNPICTQVYFWIKEITGFHKGPQPAAMNTKYTGHARSFCIYLCLFVCVWMPQHWGNTGAFLIVQCSLFRVSFVLTRLAWGVTLLKLKEGPVSRLKIAGLHMRTRGFPTCKIHSSMFSISSLCCIISKLFLMWFPAISDVSEKKRLKSTQCPSCKLTFYLINDCISLII